MKFIRELLSRKSSQSTAPDDRASAQADGRKAKTPVIADSDLPNGSEELPKGAALKVVATNDAAAPNDAGSVEILKKINAQVNDTKGKASDAAPVNIWDMDGEAPAEEVAEAAAPQRRRRRNQTRLLGFNPDEADAVTPFEKAEVAAPTARAKFPVGWMLVTDGPGRGECFSLEAGMSQIGRAEDQAVQLDFGDTSVSRVNHAAVVYDAETHVFMLGHGGKRNIVRLNGKPLISNEELTTGDEIKIGETTLRFVALCSDA